MEENQEKTVLIGMSGGVDSSVAAFLLQQQGFSCTGATMKLFDSEEIGVCGESTCCSLADVEDARSVAYRLDIPYFVFNFKATFREFVLEPFVQAYEAGLTPNPCLLCNQYLKFRKMFQRADELGIACLATGHYAQVTFCEETGRYGLKKARDAGKDQSYVLYMLRQEQLSRLQLPLGGYTKAQVRQLAEENGLVNARKRDSQDICFVPDGDYVGFLERYTGKAYPHGAFVNQAGAVLGEHRGIVCYTIGQRRGLGLSLPEPYYVCAKHAAENEVVLGPKRELFSRELDACAVNWIALDHLEHPIRAKAKIRYRHTEQWATVTPVGEDRFHLVFDEPQRAITPGQAVVLYDGDSVLGGGTICMQEKERQHEG